MAKTGPKDNWKMTDEVIQKLEQAFAIDATVGEACFYADISTSCYYNWVKEKPELLDRFERLRNKPVLTARQTVVKHLHDPDMALKYLKNKRNKEFTERTVDEHDGSIDITVDLKKLTDSDIQKELDSL